MELRKCVKCAEAGTLFGLDAKKATYCKPCFIQMVKHKFTSAIGKKRLYKGAEKRETLVVYEGDGASAFLLSLISQGLGSHVQKRLTLIPTVMVLLTATDEDEISSVRSEVDHLKSVLDVRWIFVHLSCVLCDLSELNASDCLCNPPLMSKWTSLLDSCSSQSIRSELVRLSRRLLCVRVAHKLHISKVMVSDSSDYLAKSVIHSFAFARGASVNDWTGTVDKRFPDVTIIRPLREVSLKEMALLNRFEESERYIVNVRRWTEEGGTQGLTCDFIDDLQQEGFTGTIPTILSTAAKLHTPITDARPCALCHSPADQRSAHQRFCCGCARVVEGIDEKQLLEDIILFASITTSHPHTNT